MLRRRNGRGKGRKVSGEETGGRELELLVFCLSKQQSVMEKSMSFPVITGEHYLIYCLPFKLY